MSTKLSGTYFARPSDLQKKWLLIDAKDQVLGSLSAQVAKILRGKHKCSYTPHMDCGDNIVIINAEKIKLTGKKLEQKVYYRHTGHPGGIKESKVDDMLSGKYPERVIKLAVERMLPKESPLARKQFKNLYVYAGENHPHAAQQPELVNPVKR
ncbi:50S ribosomal protein L13 [Candidatus Bandiella euplotis]|uniref:Large ribosomal subunit protein uL13 n=1 Tax=Candidatus Bandiella euplotis TaxID=1664265 RepID=A0ABZ0URF7_9RICK|nr:50S ribosomal protein L13 [Candidatus Bandiella woodruffii]WPX97303.1 50S ribosomal protein L13 [Candidatus Bandiella woodruffii]